MFFRNTVVTFLAQVLMLLFAFATSVVIARVLGPAGRGEFALVNTVARLVALVSNVGISAATIYYLNQDKTQRPLITTTALLLQLGLTLVATLVTFGLMPWLVAVVLQSQISQTVALLTLVLIPLTALSIAINNVLVGLNQINAFNYARIIAAGAQFLLVVLLVVLLSLGVTGALIATGLSLLLAIGYVGTRLHVLLPRLRLQISQQWSRILASYGVKTWIGNILQYFNYRLDFFIVNLFTGVSGVGLYAVTVTLAEFIWYIPNAVTTVLFPRTAADQQQARQFTPFVARTTLLFTSLVALGLGVVGQPLIVLCFGAEFRAAFMPLLLLLPGVVFLGTGKVLASDLAGQGKPQYGSWAATLALIVTIIFDLLLIPRSGIAGAALASTLSYILSFLVLLVLYIRESENTIRSVLLIQARDWPIYRATLQQFLVRIKTYRQTEIAKSHSDTTG